VTLRAEAAAISWEITELRHAIHREPEIGYDLPKTQAKVLAALDGLPLEITTGSKLTSVTVIPDEAVFHATVRSFSAASRSRLREETVRLVRDIAQAHGLTAEADYGEGYPVTVNDEAEARFAGATAAALFGGDRAVTPAQPLTGAEDFSYVLNEVPGAFVLLGACPPGTDPETAPSNHSAAAVFDDAVLADGTALYAELALRRLTAGT
jgi:metal-dependent amidase/aminoacylase/carboxypeptidase family protein